MTSKRTVLIVGAIGVILLIVASTRTWVHGTVNDAVLQHAELSVDGSKADPAALAAALVAGAAIVAALTTGRIARWTAAVLALLAGLLALGSVLWLVHDPAGAVQSEAAAATARSGRVAVATDLTIWVWLGVFASLVLVLAGILTIVGVRVWGGLSSRYDAPATPRARAVSAWDRLSAGEDPTGDDGDED